MNTAIRLFFALFALLFFAPNPAHAQAPDAAAMTDTLQKLEREIEAAARSGDQLAQALAHQSMGNMLTYMGNFVEAVEHLQRSIDLLETQKDKYNLVECYRRLAEAHYAMHNPKKMHEYAEKGLAVSREASDTAALAAALDLLGMAHSAEGNYKAALDCHLEATRLVEKWGPPAPLLCNVAAAYGDLGNWAEAHRYALLTAKASVESGDSSTLATAYLNEACALGRMGRHTEAQEAYDRATHVAQSIGQFYDVERDLEWARAFLAELRGDFREAYRAHVHFHALDSILSSEERNFQFAQLETAYQTRKKEQENARLSASIRRQQFIIGASIGGLALLLALAALQRNRLKIRTKLLETEQQLAAAERQKAQQEIEFHKSELANHTQLLREKTDALERIKHELEAHQQPGESADLVAQLTEATILTEEQWRSFRQKFERVHADFFNRFQQAIPDATEAEKRFAALSKLNLTGMEIASMLGISPDSVVKTRYRLRKKVADGNLERLLQDI